MNKLFKNGTFSCFSPPVMIATFVIEIGLALYTIVYRKMSTSIRLGVLLLIFLAIFQLAEYGICEQLGLSGATLAKIGFVSITLLPPIGLHLVYSLANKKVPALVPIAYGLAAVWIGLFTFGNIMNGQFCGGNYVIFNLDSNYDPFYFLFYNVLLAIGIVRATTFAKKATDSNTKRALWMYVAGYLSFIVPSIIVRIINNNSAGPDTALPSIMCGFAVLLALFLSFGVFPKVSPLKKNK